MGPTSSAEGLSPSSKNPEGTKLDLERVAECAALCTNTDLEAQAGHEWGQSVDRAMMSLASQLSEKRIPEGLCRITQSCRDNTLEVVFMRGEAGSLPLSFRRGSLADVLPGCRSYVHHGQVLPLKDTDIGVGCAEAVGELQVQGMQVMALAMGGQGYELTLVGLVGLMLPPPADGSPEGAVPGGVVPEDGLPGDGVPALGCFKDILKLIRSLNP